MKKLISYLLVLGFILPNITYTAGAIQRQASQLKLQQTSNLQMIEVDILRDGITARNAGTILSKQTFTDGELNLTNLKFTVVPGMKVALDENVKESFKANLQTREKYQLQENNIDFTAQAKYLDKVVEYPDRVRVISQTEYTYNNKTEYDAIFSGIATPESTNNARQIRTFIDTHPEYAEYSADTTKINKTEIISKLTTKLYQQCLRENRLDQSSCSLKTIKANISNEVNNYKGKRTLTETVDINKLPLIYDADVTKDFTQRLKDSNISKEPSAVRVSSLQVKRAFEQYTKLQNGNFYQNFVIQEQPPKARSCDGLTGASLTSCQTELNKLNANNAGTNEPVNYTETLLNGFTLGESYSYTLSDSYSILGFTVYDIGVSFYAGYGVGIRIPIEVNVEVNRERLETDLSEDYSATVTVDTKDKNETWFENALGENKAFNGKEAVLEAGAYAKGWVILFENTVFNEQIGGKKDWGKSLKIPFGNTEKLNIFNGIVEGNEIGLEAIIYGIHISGDLKVEGNISGDITYECRTLASEGVSGESQKCRDLDDTSLKDENIPDITVNPSTKTTNFNLKGKTDQFYYKNTLGVYDKFGLSLQRFKYKPDLEVDLFLRGKVGVDTGDYFGWFWLKTPWLKVYSFELDLPTLTAHSGYSPKSVNTYENSYIYNFAQTEQDIPENLDISTSTEIYSITNEETFNTINGTQGSKQKWGTSYLYGGKVFPNSVQQPVYQTNIDIGWYTIITQASSKLYHGYTRYHGEGNNFLRDFYSKKGSEMQAVIQKGGAAQNDILNYYSKATNALWSAELGAGSEDKKKLRTQIQNDTKIIALPGTNCSTKGETDGNNCPKANEFTWFGGVVSNGNLEDSNGMSFPFKKHNFTFNPNYDNNNNFFAYIANTNNAEIYKVKIYKDGYWGEIEDDLLGQPVYTQIIDDDNIVIVYEEKDITNNTSTYNIQKYTFENYWNSERLFVKTFDGIEDITDFYYDDAEKTIFVSTIELDYTDKYSGAIYALRFNGIENSVFKQKIYSEQLNQEQFNEYYAQLKTYGDWNTTTLNSSSLTTPLNTVISSINFDLENKNIYVLGYTHSETRGLQFVSKISYELGTSILGEPVTFNENEETPPTPTTMNQIPANQEDTTDYFSNDEYVNEKLDEINDCFLESYNGHLTNINTSIEKLEQKKSQSTEQSEKDKYGKAILKLEEIRSLYIKRYAMIKKYNELKSNLQKSTNTEDPLLLPIQ